jgi:parvulin-like peptidyl-prolyl isomerase
VARIETEDTGGKLRGGDRGLCFRKQPGLPEEVLAAAFAMQEGELSQPIRSEEGMHLVKVIAVEPAPTDAVVMARIREQRIDELTRSILEGSKLEILANQPNKQTR